VWYRPMCPSWNPLSQRFQVRASPAPPRKEWRKEVSKERYMRTLTTIRVQHILIPASLSAWRGEHRMWCAHVETEGGLHFSLQFNAVGLLLTTWVLRLLEFVYVVPSGAAPTSAVPSQGLPRGAH
jgi:hypothetical protein